MTPCAPGRRWYRTLPNCACPVRRGRARARGGEDTRARNWFRRTVTRHGQCTTVTTAGVERRRENVERLLRRWRRPPLTRCPFPTPSPTPRAHTGRVTSTVALVSDARRDRGRGEGGPRAAAQALGRRRRRPLTLGNPYPHPADFPVAASCPPDTQGDPGRKTHAVSGRPRLPRSLNVTPFPRRTPTGALTVQARVGPLGARRGP